MFQEGRAVGGSTVINGGMSWRTPEKILDALAHARPALDVIGRRRWSRTSSASSGASTSRRMDATRSATTTGCSRRAPTRRAGRSSATCATRRTASASNRCAFGCPTGAKQSALVSYMPRALHFGARVYADVRVERITRHGKRATGVIGRVGERGRRARPQHRGAREARRRRVRRDPHAGPARCARASARGRASSATTCRCIPNVKVVAIFDEDVTGWKGAHQAFQVREFEDQGLAVRGGQHAAGVLAMSLPASRPRSSAS